MGVSASPIQTACQTTGPIFRSCPAPKYCETNVLAYMQIPSGQHRDSHQSNDAGNDAASDSSLHHNRNIRSTNVRTVHERLDKTSGMAIRKTSRHPQGPDHHERVSELTVTSDMIAFPHGIVPKWSPLSRRATMEWEGQPVLSRWLGPGLRFLLIRSIRLRSDSLVVLMQPFSFRTVESPTVWHGAL